MIRSQMADHQHQEAEDELGEEVDDVFASDMEEMEYVPEPEEAKKKDDMKKTAKMNQKEMEKHLEEMY